MNQLVLSLVSGGCIGLVAGYLGSLMLSKRMSLVPGPLGHLALPGIALALIYGFNVSIGAFPFIILGIILIWLLEIKTRLPMEALTAIIFASGVSIAFLFLPIGEAEAALIGDISKVKFLGVAITVALCLLVFAVIEKIYKKMVLLSISEDVARVSGLNVKKCNFLFLGAIAIMVALGVELVGGLLTAALIAIPAASAKNISRDLNQYKFFASFLGAVSVAAGIVFVQFVDLPSGPMIAISSSVIFLISIFFKNKYIKDKFKL